MGYELIWEPRGVLKRFYGQVTDSDISDSVARIQGDRRFDTLRYVINDFLDGAGHQVPLNAVEEIAAIDDAASFSNPHIRVALVAATPDFIELAKQYAGSTLKRYPTRIFSSLDEARSWLGARVSPTESIDA